MKSYFVFSLEFDSSFPIGEVVAENSISAKEIAQKQYGYDRYYCVEKTEACSSVSVS